MKLSEDERGIAGVIELGLVGLLLIVVVFAGTRVYNATRSADQANQQAVKISESSPDFSKAEELKEEKKAEPKQEEPKTVAQTDKPPATEPKKEDKDYTQIKITATANQNEDEVSVSVALGASYSGKCEIKLKKDGQDKIYKLVTVSNSSNCSAVFDKDDIPVGGQWYVYAGFVDTDKSVQGWADTSINVTL